jgi:hypothetical protein
MKYHKYDSQTFLYIETVESDVQPEFSVNGEIPEITEYYYIAFINNEWVSVVSPNYEIIDNQFVEKNQG